MVHRSWVHITTGQHLYDTMWRIDSLRAPARKLAFLLRLLKQAHFTFQAKGKSDELPDIPFHMLFALRKRFTNA